MNLEIKGFIETSLLDWDGKIVSTLYLPGCNFRCPFCHNFGLIDHPQKYATLEVEKIYDYLNEHKDFIDGVCITGGEPCLQKERGLFDLLQTIKQMGFLIKIDTNGSDPLCLQKMLDEKRLDYIAMDLKSPLNHKYAFLAGVPVDLDKIRQSIKIIMESGLPYEFRTTVVPALLDKEDLLQMAKAVAGAQKMVLQQFIPQYAWEEKLRQQPALPKEAMENLAELCRGYVANTVVRGI